MTWSDFDAISQATPLLARVYPNGQADINHFHAAGGTGVLFQNLLSEGLMHGNARTCLGLPFSDFVSEPSLDNADISWVKPPTASLDDTVIRDTKAPFAEEGGLRLLEGNLGRSVIKVSAVSAAHRIVEAPAVVIDSQHALQALYDTGELSRDCVVVVRFQGPMANGMPELHKLTPLLSSLQDKGHAVALITDGRMSGASGKVPAAIHITPEAAADGPLARIRDGDMITLNANTGELSVALSESELANRSGATPPNADQFTVGRNLFSAARNQVSTAEQGASFLFGADTHFTHQSARAEVA
jgi:phosphogluconate dehydratase